METAGLHLPGVSPYHPGDDFEKWIKKVERYLVAINITDVHRKCAVLLHLVGDDIAETYETLPEPEAPEEDLFELCKQKLTAYLAPCRNVIAERMIFHGMKMEDKEDFEHFLGRIRVQLRRCGYVVLLSVLYSLPRYTSCPDRLPLPPPDATQARVAWPTPGGGQSHCGTTLARPRQQAGRRTPRQHKHSTSHNTVTLFPPITKANTTQETLSTTKSEFRTSVVQADTYSGGSPTCREPHPMTHPT